MITPTVRVYWLLTALFRASISFCLGYYVIFLKNSGLDEAQLVLPGVCFWAVNCLADTPTGVLADRYGRKFSFILACVLMAAGMAIYASADTLPWFILAEGVVAIGATCESGAFTAWFNCAYREELGSHELFRRNLHPVMAYSETISSVVSIVAAIAGAASSAWGMHVPYVLCTGLFLITSFCALIFMKKDAPNPQAASLHWVKHMRETLLTSWRAYRELPNLRVYILFGFIMVIAMQAPNINWALVLEPHLPTTLFGFAWMFIVLTCLIGIIVAKYLAQRRGPEFALVAKGVFTLLVLIVAGISDSLTLIVLFFLLHEIGRGSYGSTREVLLSRAIPVEREHEQATILSLDSTLINIAAVIGLSLSWLIVHAIEPKLTWTLIAVIMLIALIIFARRAKLKLF